MLKTLFKGGSYIILFSLVIGFDNYGLRIPVIGVENIPFLQSAGFNASNHMLNTLGN